MSLYITTWDRLITKLTGDNVKPLKTAIAIALPILIMLTSLGSTTYAITGNYKPDTTPYVGVVVLFSDSARQQPISYSTGILISTTEGAE